MKERVLQITVVLTSFVIALGIAEGILRITKASFDPEKERSDSSNSVYRYSSTRHHEFIPNVHWRHRSSEYDYIQRINRYGMSDRDDRDLDTDTEQVLVLGDSMIQGYGVPLEETAIFLLEEIAEEEFRQDVDIINGGVFGYSPVLEERLLQELLEKFKPDQVVVVLFLGNDVSDDLYYKEFLSDVNPEEFVDTSNIKWPWSYRHEFISAKNHEYSVDESMSIQRLFSSMVNRLPDYMNRLELVRLIKQVNYAVSLRDYERNLKAKVEKIAKAYPQDIRLNDGLIYRDDVSSSTRDELWAPTEEALLSMLARCTELGIGFSLFVLPADIGDENITNNPHQRLNEFARINQIDFGDLSAELAKYDRDELLFEIDGHFNKKGNSILANVLFREFNRLSVFGNDEK